MRTIKTTTTRYTTTGSVRGSCGHYHRTEEGAQKCIDSDMVGCVRQGGYSDRYIREVRAGARITYR